MKKITPTLLFYAVSFLTIYLLTIFSPNAHDGGLGFGSISMLLLGVIIIILMGVHLFKGITQNKVHFAIAAIHFVILALGMYCFFL